jgi:hypothetical protein
MQVQFEFTRDDLIDALRRFSARSKVVRSWKTKGILWSAFLAWLLVFGFFYNTPLKGALVGLIAAAVCALLYPMFHKGTVERRLRKLHDELLGDESSLRCEIEINQDAFTVSQMNHKTQYEWPCVTEIKETNDSVDIFTRGGGGVVVRNRAFGSAADRARFVELANTFLSQARGE